MRTVAAWTADMARPADPPGSTPASIEERAAAAAAASGERACSRMRNRCGATLLARDFYGRGAVTVPPLMVEPLINDRTRPAFTPGGGREDERGQFSERGRWPRVEKNRMLYVSLSATVPSVALEDVTAVPAVGFPVQLDSTGARVHPMVGGGDVLSVVAAEDGSPQRTVLVTVRQSSTRVSYNTPTFNSWL